MTAPLVCPKCGRGRQTGEDACARCGLLVARWAGFATAAPSHPALDALWTEVEAAWDDDARHARFLDEAAVLGALDVAAGRYADRARAAEDPRARAGLERAVNLAVKLQEASAGQAGPQVLGPAARWLKLVAVALGVALLGAAMWVLVVTLARR